MNRLRLFNLGFFFLNIFGAWIIFSLPFYFYKYRDWINQIIVSDTTENIYKPMAYLLPSMVLCMGILNLILINFGIKKKLKWPWYYLLFYTLALVIPHLISQVLYYYPPYAFFPLAFAICGLSFTGPEIFAQD